MLCSHHHCTCGVVEASTAVEASTTQDMRNIQDSQRLDSIIRIGDAYHAIAPALASSAIQMMIALVLDAGDHYTYYTTLHPTVSTITLQGTMMYLAL